MSKKFIKQLGYEYLCQLIENSSSADPFYKYMLKRKLWYEKKAFKLVNKF